MNTRSSSFLRMLAGLGVLIALLAACGGDGAPTAGGDCDSLDPRAPDHRAIDDNNNPLECLASTGVGRWWAPTDVADFATSMVQAEWTACLALIDIPIDVEYVSWEGPDDPLVHLRSGEEFVVSGTGDAFVGTNTANDAAERAADRVGAIGSYEREPGDPWFCEAP